MANTRVAVAKGFSVAVVVVLVLVGGVVLREGGFVGEGLLAYLVALLLASAGATGIWTGRYRVAFAGAVGMVVAALLQGTGAAFLLGLAVLLGVAVVVGYSGRAREHLDSE